MPKSGFQLADRCFHESNSPHPLRQVRGFSIPTSRGGKVGGNRIMDIAGFLAFLLRPSFDDLRHHSPPIWRPHQLPDANPALHPGRKCRHTCSGEIKEDPLHLVCLKYSKAFSRKRAREHVETLLHGQHFEFTRQSLVRFTVLQPRIRTVSTDE